jgi:hypothetical protein
MLEVKIESQLEAHWTWVRISVDTRGNFRVDTFVLGDDERILSSEEYTAREVFLACIHEQSGEAVAQCDVGALQVRSVTNEVIAQVVLVNGRSGESQVYSCWSRVREGTVGIQTRGTDGGSASQEVIINIVAQRSVERSTEVPVLIDELCGQTHNHVGSRALVVVAVVVVDLSIGVAVYVETLDRFTVGIVNLLINEEGVDGFAHLILLKLRVVTT